LPDSESNTPRWAARLGELVHILQTPGVGAERAASHEAARAEAWLLLNSALLRHLNDRAKGAGLAHEDREDLAAEKSLDLLRRVESGTWRTEGRAAGEIAAFVATVARHGIVDHHRRASRWVQPGPDGMDESPYFDRAMGPDPGSPLAHVERRDFVQALCDCAGQLQPRVRLAWFFRVFYDLSSKEIAAHPEIELNPAHVDVLLQRCRDGIRVCMRAKGHEPHDMPPGTFAALWKAFRTPQAAEVKR
jgi:RNA polymerase sigma factor (sigma-70 family)